MEDEDKNKKESNNDVFFSIFNDAEPPLSNEGITSVPLKEIEEVPENDFEFAKENIREVIQKGKSAMDELLEIAKVSGHPRAFEALTGLMDSIITANKELMEAKKVDQDIRIREDNQNPDVPVNNNLFITTAEFSKLVQKHNK
jgi:hypothetical protein